MLMMRWPVALGVVALLAGCTTPVPTPTMTPENYTTAQLTPTATPSGSPAMILKLPQPRFHGEVSLEETLLNRRSVREYDDTHLTLEEVSQLLWAAQGLTAEWGGRTAPSAGALYPLEFHVVVGIVSDLAPGVYRYRPREHDLVMTKDGDLRGPLAHAALDQAWVREGAIDIVIAAVYERTTGKYGEKGIQYVHMEAGHAAQNLYLQATAMELGMVTVGAFYERDVKEILGLPENEEPLYIVPVGRKSEGGPAQ